MLNLPSLNNDAPLASFSRVPEPQFCEIFLETAYTLLSLSGI